ncbi:MAG: hypothetical protein H2038_08705 [Brevundimonas sp.]|uniref:putative phage abortive infection protein n=1 Tax=Brevundimonas sp. TaxID=1871086 RepID=UPI0017ADB42A|nr:putative phage abortive infection protein [Brevundimonas sp.]MBA4804714.1 hypothetical protein [Brevundimonas sp.]
MTGTDNKKFAKIVRAAIGAAALWFYFVVVTGLLPMRNGGAPNFAVTGQFGDSFGFIGAMMAALAAYFAYRTYQAQSEETQLLRRERAEAARLRAEPSFLDLLERRYDLLEKVAYTYGSHHHEGQFGVDRIAGFIESAPRSDPQLTVMEAYGRVMAHVKNHSNLFRFIYHIVRYAERHFDGKTGDDRIIVRDDLSYQYVRLLRSQLSDSELFLIALNVLTREGEGAKRLYERYALFHNLSEGRKALVRAAGDWDERAFGLPPDPVR